MYIVFSLVVFYGLIVSGVEIKQPEPEPVCFYMVRNILPFAQPCCLMITPECQNRGSERDSESAPAEKFSSKRLPTILQGEM